MSRPTARKFCWRERLRASAADADDRAHERQAARGR
jgi:hypothetical protein